MSFDLIIQDIYSQVKEVQDNGEVASYIPELLNVNPDSFGVYFAANNHIRYGIGDYERRFSIQSVSKVFSLSLAYSMKDEDIWRRLGVEPSGTSYNSLVQLETDLGIPRNPFINAGAIVITDILMSCLANYRQDFLEFVRKLSGENTINYSAKIAASEKTVGYRNIALCNFIKSFGNIENDPEEVLDFYFDICSLEMSCEELSNSFSFLANQGVNPYTSEQVLSKSQSKRINALMQTCGFYDESGEFAFKVGLPGKSGVGGGIVAVHPGEYVISVWSPKLNRKGNSYKGMQFLEKFTTESKLSIF
ncbi:L-glutaminase [Tenacibaculum sp. MAR_2009_124]|uniref:glutaminase n=1 Tax=Tenacibaculum sp. MAR_2009_124 TaxID=1250059 RepID=UPI0008965C81|nr:glutaminase [Tenacibaculum sp. MAR_2009_124]SEC38669.1 L-glutaminase [Tenacibaculum sp. MAR_2009_124]